MNIHSPDFLRKKSIPAQYTCDGANTHPTLLFSDIPDETKSLALVMDDINSVKGIWVHWTIWNISRETTRIEEGTVPEGATEGTNTFGQIGYGGPCPNAGEHTYVFRLYALDVVLTLPQGASRESLEDGMSGHLLAQAELAGVYQRVKN